MKGTCTKHSTCKYLAGKNAAHAVGVAALLFYKGNLNKWVLGVGLENGGSYANEYNLCAGKGEKKDINSNGEYCWLETLKREFFEELKQNAPFGGGVFDSFFRGSNKKIRVIMAGRTPVFITILPAGTSRKTITAQMKADMANPKVPGACKEMRRFEYICLDNGKQIEGKKIPVSDFAEKIRKRIDVKKL